MQPFQFLYGQTPDEIHPMHVDGREQGQGEWDSKSISIGYDDQHCFAEIKAFTTDGFLQDFDEWKRIAYLMRAAPELLEALQGIVDDAVIEGPTATINIDRLTAAKGAIVGAIK